MTALPESELSESIYWEAEQYIPFDIQDVNLDYQILDAGRGGDGKGTMDVLLVAAKKEAHSSKAIVVDGEGRMRGHFNLTEPDEVKKMVRLLEELKGSE